MTPPKKRAQREQTIERPALQLRASIRPETFDAEARTVEVVFSTGARVRRSPWFAEPYDEELSLDPKHVRMARFQSGRAPVLDSHSSWRLESVIGVIESAQVDGKRGTATIRFSKREDVQPIVDDIRDGILGNLSIGYRVYQSEDVTEKGETPKRLRAVDWEPYEASIVAMGADPDASVRSRSESVETNPCVILTRTPESPAMPEEEIPAATAERTEEPKGGGTPAPKPATTTDAERAAQEAVEKARKDELARIRGIRDAVRKAGLDPQVAERLIDEGKTVDQARAAVIDALAERDAETNTSGVVATGREAGGEGTRSAIEAAILHRVDPEANKLTDEARDFGGMQLLRMGEELLRLRGVHGLGRLGKRELAGAVLGLDHVRGMHSTSDFPEVLANVVTKVLRKAYESAPSTYERFTRIATAADFKPMKRVQLGGVTKFQRVPESGEFKHGTMGEGAESYSLATWGEIVAITRQTLINDDLDAFGRLPMSYGREARDLESDLVYSRLLGGAAMSDGNPMFHLASHKNIITDALSLTGLTAGRAAMRKQTGLNGRHLNLMPVTLLVPVELETTAQQLTVPTIVANQAANANVFTGQLVPVAEPRLAGFSFDDTAFAGDANDWYLFAGTGQIDIIELAFLDGVRGPAIETRRGFDVDGVEVKARMDANAKEIDWRGAVKATVT